jgi:16S rRNA (uracil1498-N3)-methyltransferase
MHRFVATVPYVVGGEVLLDPIQSHHLARVLRLEAGARVLLIDGKGSVAEAVVEEVRPKGVRAKVEAVRSRVDRSRLSLCFALPKGQALDFIFRRATELGLEGFQPLQTRFSSPAKGWNADRWNGVVAEVCKQCEDPFFPTVLPPLTLSQWLSDRDPSRGLVVCDENARDGKIAALPSDGIDLVVGAEGGFSREEVDLLVKQGAQLLGLGRNRLRAETAAIVALTLMKQGVGELSHLE